MRKLVLPAAFAAIVLAVVALDRLIFPLLEDHRVFWGSAWSAEDKKLFKLNCLRNWASKEEPLFRTHLIQPSETHTKPRILVLGDSYVWGDGYANVNDLWWRQLERELSARGYSDVEVLAAGYPGYSLHNEVLAAEKLVPRFKPDIVVFDYTENDADEGVIQQAPMQKPTTAPAWFRNLLPNVSLFASRIYNSYCATNSRAVSDPEWELSLLHGDNFSRLQQTTKRLKQLIDREKITAIAIGLPKVPDHNYYLARFQPVKPLFADASVPFIDLSDKFCAWYTDSEFSLLQNNPFALARPNMLLRISPDNAHPSSAVTHFYAREVADVLQTRYAQLLGPTKPQPNQLAINDCVPSFASPVQAESSCTFQYPDEFLLPRMPLRKPYVQLNFKTPIRAQQIKLSAQSLRDAAICVSTVDNRLQFDTGKLTQLPNRNGTDLVWDTTSFKEPINCVLVHARFSDAQKHSVSIAVSPAKQI